MDPYGFRLRSESADFSYRLSRQINFFDTQEPFYPREALFESAEAEDEAEEGNFAVKEDIAQSICLSFNELAYSVKVRKGSFTQWVEDIRSWSNPFRKEKKQILYPMSGHFNPGRLVAIMGPSGKLVDPSDRPKQTKKKKNTQKFTFPSSSTTL